MKSKTEFIITLQGLSAHGSAPHSGHDALVAASSVVMNLQALASRINNPLNPFTLTIQSLNGGTRFNIIPDDAKLEGFFLSESTDFALEAKKILEKITKDAADIYGCTAALSWKGDLQ